MSYCRWGKDSDVYVYVTERVVKDERETWWVCCMCTLYADTPAIDTPDTVFAPTLAALKQHLEQHREKGHKVPDSAFERIAREMAEGIE